MKKKLKGDIGELIVAEDMLRRGWHVSFPYEEDLRYDLIAEKEGVMHRIQVKAVTPINGALRVNCRSSNNWSVLHYDKKDFEYLAAVNLETRKIYFIPSIKLNKNLLNIRLKSSLNLQEKKINFAEDFENFPQKIYD